MKNILAILFTLFLNQSFSQCYWQQKVSYTMDIDFDETKHQFKGTQKLVYTNNSPDELNKVFYHLYFNAFQPGSMMDVRSRTIKDPDSRVGDRISKLNKDEEGYQKITSLKMNGKKLKYKVIGTILEVTLRTPIKPGETATFDMKFNAQVPVQIRRTGRNNKEGIDYSMTQWYPKMSEYDREGWHANPYVGREFHGVWGDFDVTIHMNKKYTIAGSGVLQNPEKIGKGYTEEVVPQNKSLRKLNWHFVAKNVHDFAWAADPDYIHDIKKLNNGTKIHFFYQGDTLVENWKKCQDYTVKSFEYVNKHYGEYPYSDYSIIQGGDGGMEYPMATLITSHESFGGLVSVIVHESIHSWYQGMMATDESKYPWMDEGFTSYVQHEALDYIYKKENVVNSHQGSFRNYRYLVSKNLQEPLTTHADHYKLNMTYGISVYSKGEIFLDQLCYIIGREDFLKGMKAYYDQWRFKHPTPSDFKKVMEQVSGIELDWYLEQFIGTTNFVDYGIDSIVDCTKKTTRLHLQKYGDMPMPLDIVVKLKNGKQKVYNIPLRIMRGAKSNSIYTDYTIASEDWPWTNPSFSLCIDVKIDDIESIEIDPSLRLTDIDRTNNIFPREKKKE